MRRFTWFNATSLTLGFVFLYLPMVILVIYSFNASKLVTVWAGFSTKWYGELFRDEGLMMAVWRSLEVAFWSANTAVLLGVMASVALTRFGRFRGRSLLHSLVAAPLVMPDVIIGLSLLLLFVSMTDVIGWPQQRGLLTIWIAHATFCTAYATVVISSRLKELDLLFGSRLNTQYATRESIEEHVMEADLVIGAVLVPGGQAPHLVTREMISRMRPGTVLVDVAVDQGGCIETCRPTTHADPTFIIDDIVHYCVANMPGAVPYTSTIALTNATLPYALQLANKGWEKACKDNAELAKGLNVINGDVVYEAVAEAFDLPYVPLDKYLA